MLLGIFLGVLGSAAFIAFLFATAPVGYEDASGFHRGQPGDNLPDKGSDRLGSKATVVHDTADTPDGRSLSAGQIGIASTGGRS